MTSLLRNAAFVIAAGLPWAASAQAPYPNKPVRVVIPLAAGTALDTAVRLMGEQFQQSTGQPLIIDNKGGASGIIGNEAVAKAAPDGYTLGYTHTSTLVISPHLFKDLPYDPLRSYAYITHVTTTSQVLAVSSKVPANTLASFVSWANANPSEANVVSNGIGSALHLLAVMLNQNTGAQLVPIHYKGTGDAMKDFLGGRVQAIFVSPFQISRHVASGNAKILAVSSARRVDSLPNVPTFAELGYRDMVVDLWTGYVAPAGTPAPIVQKLYAEFSRIMAMPEFLKRMEADGYTIVGSTPADMTQMVATEFKRWGGVVKAAGLKPQ